MTAVVASDCTGLWRRTLLVGADGARDASTGVAWLQGVTAYVDSRGFAGTLHQRDDVFSWHRDIDLEPPGPFPDAGSMRWVGDVLVETGVHEHYVEHWVRDDGTRTPSGAVFLSAPDGGAGLLVRVGDLFGWAGAACVVIGTVDTPQWTALGLVVDDDVVQANGVQWHVERSEGNMNP